MGQITEAACLLQSGSMYHRRIGLKTAEGLVIFAGVKPGAVSIYFDDAPIYHFDLDGRWQRAFVEGVHYLKGLDTTVRSIDRERENGSMVLRRRTLPFGQAVDLDASIRSMALDLIDDLDTGRLEILDAPPSVQQLFLDEFRTFLERVAGWDATAWFAHRERYLGTYGPMPFLPPDCPNALVLQATLGNADGRAFGRTKAAEHYVRTANEFEQHVRAVERLLGRRIGQFSRIFLAGADVLLQPTENLVELLGMIRLVFPRTKCDPGAWDETSTDLKQINVFLDDWNNSLADPAKWIELARTDSIRVTIGIESGDPAIRSSYGRSSDLAILGEVIGQIQSAGIELGVVILVGAGGRANAETHLSQTLSLLDSWPLRPENLITLVDSRILDQTSDPVCEPLDDAGVAAQMAVFKSWSAAGRPSKRPKVVAYNPDKQPT